MWAMFCDEYQAFLCLETNNSPIHYFQQIPQPYRVMPILRIKDSLM